MRPMYIQIVSGSARVKFHSLDLVSLQREHADIVKYIPPRPHARITLSQSVERDEQISPLIEYLQKNGIPAGSIKIHYSTSKALEHALAKGLHEAGLDFGADVAEKDAGLMRYFVSTRSYESIRRNERHIVVGPKGSGKSAILRSLVSEDPMALVITPEHYATEMLNAILKDDHQNELQAFIITWKYSLLVEIFKKVVTHQAGDARSLAEIRKYLVDKGHLSNGLSLFERFVQYLRRIKEVKGNISAVGVGVGISPDDELRRLFKTDEVLSLIPKLQNVLRKRTFVVYIDELDQSWDNTKNANNFLVSLLMASIYINGIDPNLHVITFVRSEIFDLIKRYLPQLDKLRLDLEPLRWDREELVQLIVNRALDSLRIQLHEKPRPDEVISHLFASRVTDIGINGIDYIISRTSKRPREVIQFAALALRNAIQLDTPFIDEEAILKAEEEFSAWKQEHIVSEFLYIFPGLDNILERFREQPILISLPTLEDILTLAILEKEEGKIAADKWLMGIKQPLDIIKILYQAEVIGVERTGNVGMFDIRRPWEGYDFCYARPQAKPENSGSFLFHPGLWKTLEMVEPSAARRNVTMAPIGQPDGLDANQSPNVRLRKLIASKLKTDSEFEAFCLDCFPPIKRRFTQGMDHTTKVNLLLELNDSETVYRRLLSWLEVSS